MRYNLNLIKQVGEIPYHLLQQRQHIIHPGKPIRLSFGKSMRQYMLLWLPPEDAPNRKNTLAFFVHGGAWRVGAPYLQPAVARYFLDMGYPVAMPAYRLAPFAAHPEMLEDMTTALKLLWKMRSENGLKVESVLAMGMSAGATLAAHLVFNRENLAKNGFSQEIFKGFISFGGPLDLNKMPHFNALRQYAGGARGSIAWKEANPVTWLQKDETLPVLMTHSMTDAIVPIEASESFFVQYPNAKKADFYLIPGKTHMDSLRFATDDLQTGAFVRQWIAENLFSESD